MAQHDALVCLMGADAGRHS